MTEAREDAAGATGSVPPSAATVSAAAPDKAAGPAPEAKSAAPAGAPTTAPRSATTAPAAPAAVQPGVLDDRRVYASSVGRATVFSLLFLILLPFFLSIPMMIFMRVKHGLVEDTLGLVILGIGFAILMFLLLAEVLFSIRNRVEIGDKSLRVTVPMGGGPTPLLRYVTHDIPYDRIKSVETRREIYGGSIAPVLMRGARVITTDERAIRLGYVNERNEDPAFPYLEIARKIAARAGVEVTDRGNHLRSVQKKMLGIMASPGDTIEERDVERINARHARVMMGLVGVVVLLVGIGIASDLMSEPPPSAASPPAATAPQPKTK